MYKYLVKDENFKTIASFVSHNLLNVDGDGYYHITEDGYNFLIQIEDVPKEDGYLLYSGLNPEWKKKVEAIVEHNNLLNIQGDGYYHLTQSEHDWLVDGYNDGYWKEEFGGTGKTNYNEGDLLIGNNTFGLDKLPKGNDGEVLKVIGGDISWEEINIIANHNELLGVQGDGYYHLTQSEYDWLTDGYNDGYWKEEFGGTGKNSYNEGDLLIGNNSFGLDKLPKGNDGEVLKIVSGDISWEETNIIENHNELNNIQGGSGTDGYYHLTQSEHDWLTDGYNDGYWKEDKGGTGKTTYNEGDLLIGNDGYGLDILPSNLDGYNYCLGVSYDVGLSKNIVSWEKDYYNAIFVGKVGSLINDDGYLLTNLDEMVSEDFPVFITPFDSNINNLWIRSETPPGDGYDLTVIVRKNYQDTDLKAVISNTEFVSGNLTNNIYVVQNDIITIRSKQTIGGNAGNVSACMVVENEFWTPEVLVKPGDNWLFADLDASGARVFNTQPNLAGGWAGADWAGAGLGPYTHTAGVGNTAALAIAALIVNNRYLTRFTVSGRTAGTVTHFAGTTAGTARATNATFTEELTCTTNNSHSFVPTEDFDGVVTIEFVRNAALAQVTCKGNLGNLVQAAAGNMPWSSDADAPTSVLRNGKHVIYGAANADFFNHGNTNFMHDGSGGTVVCVQAPHPTVVSYVYISSLISSGNGTNISIGTAGNVNLIVREAGGVVYSGAGGAGTVVGHSVITARISAAETNLRVNGTTVASTGATAGHHVGNSTFPPQVYSNKSGMPFYFLINRYLSDPECIKLEAYLRSYYAL